MSVTEPDPRDISTAREAEARPGVGVRESYRSRKDAFLAETDRQRVLRDRFSAARLLVFLLTAGAIGVIVTNDLAGSLWWWLPPLALIVVFIRLVRLQRLAEEARERAWALARLNREAAARVDRVWALLPAADYPGSSPPPVARDLDLFGSGSLFQLLGTARTPAGRRILASWLLEAAAPPEVRARQAAVRELAPLLDLRQELERNALRARASEEAAEGFCRWAERPDLLSPRSPHVVLARVLPILLVLFGVGRLLGLLPPLWIPVVTLNAFVWIFGARRISAEIVGVELRAEALASFEALFERLEKGSFRGDRLLHIQRLVRPEGGVGASESLRRLRRIAGMAEVRFSPLLYPPLQLFFLWDTHVLHAMDRWRRESGTRARDWLEAVGQMEALSALAGLSLDNPDWSFPEIDPGASEWRLERLGHPLLPRENRVANDVRLGPPGRFLLVTGSNMSGKSTLLRAVGTNIALAQAGGPVCAARFHIPPTKLGTSFVVEDSLQSGISYFMAELRRLKTIVEEARGAAAEEDWRYLFLLDEILKGTNSGERQIAVRRILSELLASGAAGAISSHDLALADVPALLDRSTAVHFREQYVEGDGAPRMAFDYVLHDGVATTSNALALLEMMGIPREG